MTYFRNPEINILFTKGIMEKQKINFTAGSSLLGLLCVNHGYRWNIVDDFEHSEKRLAMSHYQFLNLI